ncbi:DUF2599 domain-containing protein [Rathayibacter sp. PhB127]|uniref:DUF2599 domain-containing protein n=1 Tax=Rathayibacter sp. PhB127 TaxID=2485176 RepID=UPI0011CD67A1|nr:DUF2599 domain-containing protein [Rathayibacter sp. PhB127]
MTRALLAVSVVNATAAHAADSDADDVVKVLESVPTEIPLLQGVTTGSATDLVEAGNSSSERAAIRDVADVFVSGAGKKPLAVELLAAQNATEVSVSSEGIEVIDNGNGSSTVPLKHADGSLQIVTVIESSNAPTEYAVDVELPLGVVLTPTDDGALLATDSNGALVLGVAPAWAYDADGVSVPTRYVVQDTKIVQIVDHASGNFSYPVSADPWLGVRLFDPMTVNRQGTFNGRNVYSGRLTPWGVTMGLSAQGHAIMAGAGWEEFASQWSAVRSSTSLYQQYQCHAAYGRAIIGAGFHWDLEASRPANGNWPNVLAHRCNW